MATLTNLGRSFKRSYTRKRVWCDSLAVGRGGGDERRVVLVVCHGVPAQVDFETQS